MNERILLIENERNLQLLRQKELEQQGYKVTTTADSEEAIEKLKDESVDLVVVDLRSSEKFELEYLQKIMNVDRDVKVVLNSDNPATAWDFRSWAADAFLVRPENLTQLKDTIARILHS